MNSNRPGITLLEVIVAMAIIGTAAVAGLSAGAMDLRMSDMANEVVEANALAQTTAARVLLRELPPNTGSDGSYRHFDVPFHDFSFRTSIVREVGMAGELVLVSVRGERTHRELTIFLTRTSTP